MGVIETGFEAVKGEAGLDEYETRSSIGATRPTPSGAAIGRAGTAIPVPPTEGSGVSPCHCQLTRS